MSAFKTWLTGLTSKTTPVDADELYVLNSVGTASNKLTWANLKTTLASTFLSLTGGTVAGGTRTTSGSTLTITETLNNAAVTFPGALVINQTHTASAAGSLLADLKVGGASKFQVAKDGIIKLNNAATIDYGVNQALIFTFSVNGSGYSFAITSAGPSAIQYSFAAYSGGAADIILMRDAANTLAQRNSTNAQTSRLYGTYTDSSNYRRVALAMTTAGVATITPEGAGTGASGNVLHISGLPTSNPGAGILWNDAGTVKVGT